MMNELNLPEGWEVKTLNQISENLDKRRVPITKKNRIHGLIPYYGASGIVDYVENHIFDEDLLLVSEDGANLLARTYPIAFSISGKTWVNNHAHVLRFKDKISQRFVELYLNSIKLDNFVSGMAQPKLNQKMVNNIPIPFPPISKQKRIVAILNEVFENIARAKENAENNLKNANEIFESYLQSVFENKGEGWEEMRLDKVADKWGRIGWKGLTAKEYTSEGPLFLSVHSLNYGVYVDFRDAFHISQERYDESPEIMLRKNDILICKDGAGIGKLGIVPELSGPSTINSSLLLIRCKKNIITKYLYYNLLSPIFQNIVKSRLMGATTPHLYQRDIVTFPILVPSLAEQKTIVAKLDALSTETKKLEAIYTQKLADFEELKKSILQKAFDGELTEAEMLSQNKLI